jgi:hypothetical protein
MSAYSDQNLAFAAGLRFKSNFPERVSIADVLFDDPERNPQLDFELDAMIADVNARLGARRSRSARGHLAARGHIRPIDRLAALVDRCGGLKKSSWGVGASGSCHSSVDRLW